MAGSWPATASSTQGELASEREVASATSTGVMLCSGKVYWDLVAERTKRQDDKTAIVRLEQLYPLDAEGVLAALEPYPNAQLVWVQDEPANQGPWPFIALNLPEYLDGRPLLRVSRPAAASPAAGSTKKHAAEQATLIAQAFDR